jgi:hypothetical protein
MGQAREVMDRVTADATESQDWQALAACYADVALP